MQRLRWFFWEARNESSDIWSLGCVFLGILTVLNGETLKTKDLFFGDNGNGGKNPRVNPQALTLWLSKLSKSGDEDSQPNLWVQQMLQVGPKDRISSVCLLDAILGYTDQYIYYGHCCADHEEEVSSCNSSECLDDDSVSIGAEESTNATSVGSEVEGRKLPSTNIQSPGERKGKVPQHALDKFLGVSQGLRNISTTLLSDDSTSQSVPADTITPARPQPVGSNVISAPTGGEGIGRPSPGPGTIPVLHSRNPFRPGYTPSPLLRPAPPRPSSSERLAHTQNRPSSFWARLDDNSTVQEMSSSHQVVNSDSAVHEVRNDGRDSFISRAWPLNVETAHPETPPNDASPGPKTSRSSSAYQNSTDGASNSVDNLYPLREAAAKGDVPALLKYSLAGSNLNEGALGRSAFHAAGVNNQRMIMQLLLDLGCPVYSSDVADYILPMVGTGELMVDPLKPVHRSVIEQIDSIRKGQEPDPMRRDQEKRPLPSRGNVPSDAVALQGYSDVYDHVYRKTTSTSDAIDVRRNEFSNPARLPTIGPWDPAGFHWDLEVRPDPDAMHEAIRRGHASEVINCLNEGYVVHFRDQDDQSPLDIAISYGLVSIIELLISYGANPRAVDSQGKDAYAKSQYRFFGLELDQVIDLLDRSKNYNPYVCDRPNQPQLPTTVQLPWAHFLAQQNQEDGSYG